MTGFRYSEFASKHLGLVVVTGAEATLICPFHADTRPSFRLNLRTGLWLCNSCEAKGNIDQLAQRLGVAVIDAGVSPEALQRRLRAANRSRRVTTTRTAPTMAEEAIKRFIHHPYWSDERGYTQATIYRFQLGYDPITDQLTIPIRDSFGSLLGIIYRKFTGRPRYSYPRGFARGKSLFASWMVREEIHQTVMVEGPLDSIACWNAGLPSLGLLGSSISEGQVQLLQKLSIHRVLLMMDNDAAGKKATDQVMDALYETGIQRQVVKYQGSDPGELSLAELRRVIRSAGSLK